MLATALAFNFLYEMLTEPLIVPPFLAVVQIGVRASITIFDLSPLEISRHMQLKIKTGTQQVRTGNVYTRAITCVWKTGTTAMALTWYRHFQGNGGLNQILRRQTSRFHYG
jgi:hypothetical protein